MAARCRWRERCWDDTWLVEDLAALADDFAGVAVTLTGRVWSARTRELRQAPAVGEDRVLAERNRREAAGARHRGRGAGRGRRRAAAQAAAPGGLGGRRSP